MGLRPYVVPDKCRRRMVVFGCALACVAAPRVLSAQSVQDLPDAPSALLGLAAPALLALDSMPQAGAPQLPPVRPIPPCDKVGQPTTPVGPRTAPSVVGQKRDLLCIEENPLQPIVSARVLPPLTWQQKGKLAVRDVVDPFTLVTVTGYSAVVIGVNPHTAYGPGFKGFGKLTGYSLLEDTQGEFFGTFLIPSLVREDPRYHRMPGRPVPQRVLHAIGHTFVSHHDGGAPMPNYATLLTYPISAELSNLYVPGIGTSAPATGKRVGLGIATDPIGTLVAEFLPDIARRIHVRVIFVQQILQQVADGTPSVQ